ncbi:PAS domain S-box protein [Candidatus Methanoperedens nitratireducens]|uniref:Putative Histidine kinase n=1 Tax=Candidatus Methanoperedens nitratireducens TaxID=1392998 RepID=A0A284VJ57_9EURY|nr:PAS domain S-box protein [Candidatus Methanoperedens nitroreducens]SNQ59325.1 putative Histidine kinase [Candidatus Methanoperedens nitroreducens]
MKLEKSETLRKLAEEANSLLVSIVESSDDAIIGKTLDGTILSWNLGAQKIYGYTVDEVKGRSIFILVPPDKTDEVHQLLERVRQGLPVKRYETVRVRKDGKRIDVSLTSSPIKDSTGRIIGASTVTRDISERKRAEEELRRAHDELEIRVKERTAELVEANEVLQAEITERKRVEQALLESEKRYRSLFENMLDGFAYCKMFYDDYGHPVDFIYLKINSAFEGLTGLENVVGKKITELIPGIKESYPELFEIYGRVALTGKPEKFEMEFKPLKAWLSISVCSTKREYFVAVFENITERKLAEEALRKARNELEMLVQERTAELKEVNMKLEAEIAERKQAEKTLRSSEAKYRGLAESVGEVFYALDKDLRYIYWNNASEKLTGILAEDAIGKSLFELFPELKGSKAEKLYREVLKTQRPKRFVNKYRVNGKNLIFEINAYYSKFGISVIAKDITERRRAEEEIHLLQTMTRAINEVQDFHSAMEVVLRKVCEATGWDYGDAWFRSKDGTVLECSPAWYGSSMSLEGFRKLSERFTFPPGTGLPGRVWASKKAEWIQDISTCSDTIYPRARIARDAGLKACVGIPIIVNDQVLAVLVFHMFEFREEDKRLVVTISAMATQLGLIIQRKQAEEKIREQATLLDNAQEAIGVRSLEHNLIYWNKGAERLYGWTAEEATGKNPVDFMFKGKEEPPQLIEAKRSVLEKGEWTGELHQITKDGRDVVVESHWTLICDSEGKPKSILVINTDITEKRKFEMQLLRAQRMESIGTLAGGIAHDLNNVLTPIMMSLQTLEDKFQDEQSQKLLTILERNLLRGSNLIKHVMSFARGIEGERKPLQAAHIISEVEKVAKETFNKNIEIKTDISRDLFTISADATQLHQVLMNLCVNARDAMPDGGILRITASDFYVDESYARMNVESRVGQYIIITVSDTGTGIPPEIIGRIFEPFFTTKEPGKGTGLGLSTSIGIVKSHGGFINVSSEVGKGTTFKIYLPAFKTEMQGAQMHQPELLTGNGELILVAEDEGSIREITCSTLETYGYEAIAAEDGVQAVAEYARNMDKIKVILMDMMMPVMDGQASIRAVRKINPEVKIIAISGLAEEDKLKNIADHTNAFLPKPYTAEKLLKTIHEVLITK